MSGGSGLEDLIIRAVPTVAEGGGCETRGWTHVTARLNQQALHKCMLSDRSNSGPKHRLASVLIPCY